VGPRGYTGLLVCGDASGGFGGPFRGDLLVTDPRRNQKSTQFQFGAARRGRVHVGDFSGARLSHRVRGAAGVLPKPQARCAGPLPALGSQTGVDPDWGRRSPNPGNGFGGLVNFHRARGRGHSGFRGTSERGGTPTCPRKTKKPSRGREEGNMGGAGTSPGPSTRGGAKRICGQGRKSTTIRGKGQKHGRQGKHQGGRGDSHAGLSEGARGPG